MKGTEMDFLDTLWQWAVVVNNFVEWLLPYCAAVIGIGTVAGTICFVREKRKKGMLPMSSASILVFFIFAVVIEVVALLEAFFIPTFSWLVSWFVLLFAIINLRILVDPLVLGIRRNWENSPWNRNNSREGLKKRIECALEGHVLVGKQPSCSGTSPRGGKPRILILSLPYIPDEEIKGYISSGEGGPYFFEQSSCPDYHPQDGVRKCTTWGGVIRGHRIFVILAYLGECDAAWHLFIDDQYVRSLNEVPVHKKSVVQAWQIAQAEVAI